MLAVAAEDRSTGDEAVGQHYFLVASGFVVPSVVGDVEYAVGLQEFGGSVLSHLVEPVNKRCNFFRTDVGHVSIARVGACGAGHEVASVVQDVGRELVGGGNGRNAVFLAEVEHFGQRQGGSPEVIGVGIGVGSGHAGQVIEAVGRERCLVEHEGGTGRGFLQSILEVGEGFVPCVVVNLVLVHGSFVFSLLGLVADVFVLGGIFGQFAPVHVASYTLIVAFPVVIECCVVVCHILLGHVVVYVRIGRLVGHCGQRVELGLVPNERRVDQTVRPGAVSLLCVDDGVGVETGIVDYLTHNGFSVGRDVHGGYILRGTVREVLGGIRQSLAFVFAIGVLGPNHGIHHQVVLVVAAVVHALCTADAVFIGSNGVGAVHARFAA